MFFDLTTVPPNERLELVAHVKSEIARQIGLPVSVGIGATKTISKLANKHAKRSATGLFDLSDRQRLTELLSMTPVEDIWGIGPQRALYLHENMQVHTALDLTHVPDGQLRRALKLPVVRLAWELRGQSALPLLLVPSPAHTIARARSFGKVVTEFEEMHEALTYFVTRAAEQLRRQRRAASHINVFLMTNPFRKDHVRYSNACLLSLPQPSNSTLDLLAAASVAFTKIFRHGYEYTKIGVSLLELVPESPLQRSLFFGDPADSMRQLRLMDVVDLINQRFGQDTLRVAGLGLDQGWQRRAAYPSPRLTTRWAEIPVIRT